MGKQLMAYQSEIVLVEKGWKRTAVTWRSQVTVAKERRNMKIWTKSKGSQFKRMWHVKMSVIPVVIRVIGVITSKGERGNRPSGRILCAVYTHFTYMFTYYTM